MVIHQKEEAKMAVRKIKAKLILQLYERNHLTQRSIAQNYKMSRSSISEVLNAAKERNIHYSDIENKSEEEVYDVLFPEKFSFMDIYESVDYEYVHKELSKTGVTLKLLWQEYGDECKKKNVLAMGYTRFCEGYSNFTNTKQLTKRIERKPGDRIEVDWSGPTMKFTDSLTGEVITVYLFVAAMSYSMYAYVDPTLDMKMKSWINCNIHMLEYFNGVTNRIICDNLKTGVISHPRDGEIILTDNYRAFAEHYMVAIMPAGIKKPKQKAGVENTVGNIATAIIAKLRKYNFNSFEEVKIGVSKALEEFNSKPFQKRDGSRYSAYQEEKVFLRPLPDIPYEVFETVKGRKVGLNFHISYKNNYYSVPYMYAKTSVDLKVSENMVEIYQDNQRIASHKRFKDYEMYKYSTNIEHMPPQFIQNEWDDVRIKNWASSIGENTRKVINKIFESYKIKEQAYNPALSVLKLSKAYSQNRLENACELALEKYRVPRYHHLNALLSHNQDVKYIEDKNKSMSKSQKNMGYLRGAEYYGGKKND